MSDQQSTDDPNHGKKPRKFNQGCTICHSCRWAMSDSTALKWRVIGWQTAGIRETDRSTRDNSFHGRDCVAHDGLNTGDAAWRIDSPRRARQTGGVPRASGLHPARNRQVFVPEEGLNLRAGPCEGDSAHPEAVSGWAGRHE